MGLLESFLTGALQGTGEGLDYVTQQRRQRQLDAAQVAKEEQETAFRRQAADLAQQHYQHGVAMDNLGELRQRGGHLMGAGAYDQAAQLAGGPLSQALTAAGLPGVGPIPQGAPESTVPGGGYYQGPTPTGAPMSTPTSPYMGADSRGALSAAFNYEPEKPQQLAPGASLVDREGKILTTAPYGDNPYKQTAEQVEADKLAQRELLASIAKGHDATHVTITGMTQAGANGRAQARIQMGPKDRLVQDPDTGEWVVVGAGSVTGVKRTPVDPAVASNRLDAAVLKRYPRSMAEQMSGVEDPRLGARRAAMRRSLEGQRAPAAQAAPARGAKPPARPSGTAPSGAGSAEAWLKKQ